MQKVFMNLGDTVQMQEINKTPVDFEVVETVEALVVFDAVIQVMKPRDVDRKPEGLRQWKFWNMWTDFKLKLDAIVQNPDGTQFRIQSVEPWEQAGFFKFDMVEQPKGLGTVV